MINFATPESLEALANSTHAGIPNLIYFWD